MHRMIGHILELKGIFWFFYKILFSN